MDFSAITNTQIVIAVVVVLVVIAGIAVLLSARKSRTEKLQTKFGGAEYARAMEEVGSKRKAEAVLDKRADRVQKLQIKPLSPEDRARYIESWRGVQARFVDSPGGAVMEADQLLGAVMSTRGYPVSDFDQRAADISVDHPLVLENYRSAHAIAVRQTTGQASTEELRQAMIHYRTLFDDLVGAPAPEVARAKAAA